ncbi:MAG: YggS family pyridoxal phosphate-dependent enzyme [Flavobacteriaceae bacterium]|jgi:pyridoxal phosphate enzyme (YggS family)|nr:YggS family pyridoxal phosphate-dependent enzyme [Flavobacteriaceae bacterium]
MNRIAENINYFKENLPQEVTLVAVSKTKPAEDVQTAYDAGHLDFGENRVQEMVEKYEILPKDIRWHQIGHLQKNKVKYIAPFVHLIHSVDSESLLKEINKQALRNERTISCLLQIRIADEETKFGMEQEEAEKILSTYQEKFPSVKIIGLMGMSTFTEDKTQIRNEFRGLKIFFDKLKTQNPELQTLSMGMSGDYQIAMEEGSNMIRVGSSVFGNRNYG